MVLKIVLFVHESNHLPTATHLLVAVSQLGVAPAQLESSKHCTHTLAVVSHTLLVASLAQPPSSLQSSTSVVVGSAKMLEKTKMYKAYVNF